MNDIVVKEESNTVMQQQSAMPARMLELAIQQDADIDKLEKLMDLQERYDARQAKSDYLSALSAFQSECPIIQAKKEGHGYKYAPLGDIVAQVKDLLAKHGLSYRFEQKQEGDQITVACITSHRSGHSEKLIMSGAPDVSYNKQGKETKSSIQAAGSTVTYLRRYTLTGALGIVTADEDSDGRVAQSQFKPCTADQIASLDKAVKNSGKDEQSCGNYVNSKLGINVSNWAQLSSGQADAAISILEGFNASN